MLAQVLVTPAMAAALAKLQLPALAGLHFPDTGLDRCSGVRKLAMANWPVLRRLSLSGTYPHMQRGCSVCAD